MTIGLRDPPGSVHVTIALRADAPSSVHIVRIALKDPPGSVHNCDSRFDGPVRYPLIVWMHPPGSVHTVTSSSLGDPPGSVHYIL